MLDYDDPKIYDLLVKVCSRYQVDPSVPLESEVFFRELLSQYDDPPEHLQTWLEKQLSDLFIAIGARPRWIQGANWPFASGKPMVFVGQIDIRANAGPIAPQYFHDDTSFYLFIQREGKGTVKVITQQF